MIKPLTVNAITGADLQFIHAIQHIKLRQRDSVDTVDLDRLANQHRVEPAAASGTPGDRAEFATTLAQPLADVIFKFGREWAAADPRRVRLDDTQDVIDGARPLANADGGLPGNGVG